MFNPDAVAEKVEETPVEEIPVEETPVEETLVEETPVEETPIMPEDGLTDFNRHNQVRLS